MRRGVIDPDIDRKLHRDLARRLDAQGVLDHYGAENSFEQTNKDGTREIVHSCLIDRVEPHHSNGDANPSASCNIDHGIYVCYSYTDPVTNKSGMDMVDLVLKLERKKKVSDVLDVLNPHLSGSTKESDDFVAQLRGVLTPADTAPVHAHRTYGAKILDSWAYIHPYLATRGIDDATASDLQIGYDQVENRITIPHFWRGSLVGWQKRAIPERKGEWPGTRPPLPKYRNSPGFPKSTTLYRLPVSGESGGVCVVESPFSTIRSVALGLDIPVAATFGAKITEEQTALLRGFQWVIVWMDPDDAGRSAERKLVDRLHRHTEVLVVTPDDGMDLADYPDADAVVDKMTSAKSARTKILEWQNAS